MLLYHFPLTSSSSTPNYENKGFAEIYNDNALTTTRELLRNTTDSFVSGGKLSSYCKGQSFVSYFYTKAISSYSIAVRVNYDYNDITRFVVFNRSTSGNNRLFSIQGRRIVDNNVVIEVVKYNGSDYPAVCSKTTTRGTWHDIVITFDTQAKVYIDAVLLATIELETTDRTAYRFDNNGWIPMVGDNSKMQDFRIYDYTLSQAEINEYSRALVVHYPLQGNELNPSVLKDVSGFGNDAYKTADSVVEFDYFNDNIRGLKYADDNKLNKRLGYTSPKNFYPNFNTTICYWTKFTITSEKAIVIFRTSNNGSYLNGTNKNVYGYIQTNDGNVGNWTGRLTENKWYFIAFTFEQSGSNIVAKSYVNGNLYNTNTRASTISVTETQLDLINYNNNASIFSICDYRVYATALSAQDIKNLYNSPIAVSNQHQTMAFELNENPLYPSKYWRTPTYVEMNYILTQRTNASNLRTLGRVDLGVGTYRNGLFLLPDGFVAPSGIIITIPPTDITTNTFTLQQLRQLENIGVVFFPLAGYRTPPYSPYYQYDNSRMYVNLGGWENSRMYALYADTSVTKIENVSTLNYGRGVRLIHNGTHFSTSATTKIDFAPANLQYHCTQHIWRFAEHSYDIIGSANANTSDSYNGWIDLFGYGTSGVNYSPTLHTTNNADYASGDIANTDNDWGVNEIQSYDYNVKNFAVNKNGIVQHNELRENNSDVNGCYKDKIITNKIIEN